MTNTGSRLTTALGVAALLVVATAVDLPGAASPRPANPCAAKNPCAANPCAARPATAVSAAAVKVGDAAPDFLLPSTQGTEMGPGQFAGKKLVLIYFYSQDFNPT